MKLKKMQHNFSEFVTYEMNKPMDYTYHNCSQIQATENIITQEAARLRNDSIFLNKIINDHVNCPKMKFQIEFYKHLNDRLNFSSLNSKIYQYSSIQKLCQLFNLNEHWLKYDNEITIC